MTTSSERTRSYTKITCYEFNPQSGGPEPNSPSKRDKSSLRSVFQAHEGLSGRTHSWTVQSGTSSGIRPLFSRLQSTSPPEQEQGEGHPEPRSGLRDSRKITASLAKVRGCAEGHIVSRSVRIQVQEGVRGGQSLKTSPGAVLSRLVLSGSWRRHGAPLQLSHSSETFCAQRGRGMREAGPPRCMPGNVVRFNFVLVQVHCMDSGLTYLKFSGSLESPPKIKLLGWT